MGAVLVSFAELAQYRGLLTMVDGAFDPLHPGHVAYLDAARGFGYPLLVNICPDSYTRTKHPILLPALDRAKILDAFQGVRRVHLSDVPTVDVLKQLQPKHYVKGADWRDKLPADQVAVCRQQGTSIAFVETPRYSSTALLQQFQPDVDAFEDLVLSQQPASQPWKPTEAVPYDFESRKKAEGRHPQLIRDVLQPENVLDYGCGPGHLIALLRHLGIPTDGYEPSIENRHLEQPTAKPHIIRDWISERQYDVVINREVQEHCTVREIAMMIRRLCRLSSRLVYGTTRWNLRARHLLDFATEFDIDPTHISCGTLDFLRVLFSLEGFRFRADLAAAMDWLKKGRAFVFERAA